MWTVDRKGPSIFLYFKYIKNYVMKLLNIGKKFVINSLMGLKFEMKLRYGVHYFENYQR